MKIRHIENMGICEYIKLYKYQAFINLSTQKYSQILRRYAYKGLKKGLILLPVLFVLHQASGHHGVPY